MKRIQDGNYVEVGAPPELPWGRTGIFETILLRDRELVFWPEHFARLDAGCRWCGLPVPFSADELAELIREIGVRNSISTGAARVVVWFRGGTGPATQSRDSVREVSWAIDVTPPRPHMGLPAFRLTVSSISLGAPDPSARFKHLSRSRWAEALRVARNSGWDEALLCDRDGRVAEGSVTNVFFVCDGQVCTPERHLGGLPGIVRGEVIRLTHTAGLKTVEGSYPVSDLAKASEVWVTNSLIGIRPVSQLDEVHYSGSHPVLRRFRAAWVKAHGWDPAEPVV